ncbi:MAG: cytochrome C [Betaproteobacteria bacterium]|jgi:cytochrome c|nr:cytochrome C [Betaproteobacteria bacterium]
MKKAIVMAAVAVAALATAGLAMASGEEDAKKAGCLGCHAVDAKKMGPSYKSVAAKFAGKKDTDLVAAIKAAKPHGSVKVSDGDLKEISAWILTLK